MLLPNSVHIFDPELKGPGGHNLTQDLLISQECRKRGVPVQIYANASANIIPDQETVNTLFRFDLFVEQPQSLNGFSAFENFFLVNRAFFLDLQSKTDLNFCSDDLVYFPGITQNQIEAVADWLTSMDEKARPRVAITLRWLNSKMLYNVERGLTSSIEFLYRHSLIKLLERHPRTRLFSDTRPLAAAYSAICGLQIGILPVPQVDIFKPCPNKNRAAGDPINVLYIGNLSAYRGAHLLPEIVNRVISIVPNVHFTIQAQQQSESELVGALTTLRYNHPNHTALIMGTLSPEEYSTTMAAADIVIFPYMPAFYSWASSGVFVEASAIGKVTVVPAGTTLDSVGREFGLGFVAAEDWTAESFSSALANAIYNFEHLEKTAQISSERFREANSSETFVQKLFSSALS
jgi:glycosyltransferase involved in cell wall biosynthesis